MFEYCLDITSNSYTNVYTPDSVATSLPFYLYEIGYFEANSNYFTIRDGMPKYLLIYTLSGSGMVKVNEKIRYLTAGTAVLIDCRDLHEYRTVSTSPWCFHYLHFDGIAMDTYKKLLLDEFEIWEVCDRNRFMKYINKIYDLSNQHNILLHNIHSCNLISLLLTSLFDSDYSVKAKADIDSDAIRKACSFIEENLESKISIEELSSLVKLSKYYFIRLFQRVMGVTPYLYIQILRVNRAKELLVTTEYSIGEIAKAVGFSSCTRFSRYFFDMTGTSPSHYRKSSYSFMKDEI